MIQGNNSTKETSKNNQEQWVTPEATVLSTQETLAGGPLPVGDAMGSGADSGTS